MPSLVFPPLPPASELPSLTTLNSLGELAVEFAVRQLWASDEIVPLQAVEVLQQHPAEAADLILETFRIKLIEYTGYHINPPRSMFHCLIVLGSLQHPGTAARLLKGLVESEAIGVLAVNCEELLPAVLAESIPDLSTWRLLADRFGSEYGEILAETLAYVVFRESLNRNQAARELIAFVDDEENFDDDDDRASVAARVVDTLLCFVVPETLDDVCRINELAPPEEQKTQEQIEVAFAQAEAILTLVAQRLADQRPTDVLKCCGRVDFFPPNEDLPESVAESIRLICEEDDHQPSVLLGCRYLIRQADSAIPQMLSEVTRHLQTRPQKKSKKSTQELTYGPAQLVRVLLELRSPEVLPLLLGALESAGTDCLLGYSSIVEPALESLVALTAPSTEFVVGWIRRLASQERTGEILVTSLGSMVLEERADRVETMAALRELFVGWVNSPDAARFSDVANMAATVLMTLGDVDFFRVILNTKGIPADSIRQTLVLLGDTDEFLRDPGPTLLLLARSWFLEERFINTSERLFEDLVEEYSGDDFETEQWRVDSDVLDSENSAGKDMISAFLSGMNPSNQFASPTPGLSSFDDDFSDSPPDDSPGTIRNTTKVGRNDPCPCGSGRKYKKCCGT